MNFKLTRALVKNILQSPFGLKWSVQGLGMLRTYLDSNQQYRLHIWDHSLRVPHVSPIHDHPWDLSSLIVSGKLRQTRFHIAGVTSQAFYLNGEWCEPEMLNMVSIKCGENACTKSEPITVKAYRYPVEVYTPGETYMQHKNEVHESLPEIGTVTIVDRTFYPDRDTARVFWRGDGGWVDAAPRPATEGEIREVTRRALEVFDVQNIL